MKYLILIVTLLVPYFSQAQSYRSGLSRGITGINGGAGFGFTEFDVKSPAQQFTMDDGVFAYLGGERGIGDSGFFVTIAFNYMKSEGQSFYNYTTLDGSVYANNPGVAISFDAQIYQLALGLKKKFFSESWFRPYVEGGGLFGYFELKHNPAGNIACTGTCANPNGFKRDDTLAAFGYYGEAGVEIDFAENYGVRVGGRYQEMETREFETLGNQKIKFSTLVFQFALQRSF